MTYIIIVYIIVYIVGIYVGIKIMVKRQDMLDNYNMCKTKDVTIIL